MQYFCSCHICKINPDGGKWLSTKKTFKKYQEKEKAFIEKINESETESSTNCIKHCGPSWTHWQFLMERVCDILQPLIKSRLNPYSQSCGRTRIVLGLDINNYGMKYGRLRTSDGQYVSSHWIKKKNKITRNNCCVQIYIYGIVDYFFVHNYNDKIHMLAYVQLTSKVMEDEYECKYFTQFKSKEFIDVRCIDHCVGFAKIGSKYFIIDKENAFDDANWENLE
ncbi:hypothetical protein GLOIN_2v1480212 [Rhizophagus clarus]|uniref:Uncharacterized protein n=2 Tax=Rhizophagus clarus TaxID=94130 RepID=A0A8H3M216_9GLOM|nr:hypothetical protein GLOIN_2v1480212 [Rhizophagus clarus]